MNRFGARFLCGANDLVDHQVALICRRGPNMYRLIGNPNVQRSPIRIRIHGDRRYAQLPPRSCDTHRDLSSIGDQEFLEHRSESLSEKGKSEHVTFALLSIPIPSVTVSEAVELPFAS